MRTFLHVALAAALFCAACRSEQSGTEDTAPVSEAPAALPDFNADSAYNAIARQVAFGPRVPGSASQKSCAAWMQAQLQATCDTVYRQETTVRGGDGKQLPCINLVGAINPAAAQRILLLAHWDSRSWADMDAAAKDQPIDAADDGASGVAVLLEIARQLKAQPLPAALGVDILLVDVEDYGKTEWGDSSYGLGTQYWARHPHVAGYRAEGGILLDMVGARGARFPMEGFSQMYAAELQQRVWQTANRAGFSSYFLFEASNGGITDDHTFVNEIAHIPTIDIIHLTRSTASTFPPHWHTHGDNLSVIDKATLDAVGRTLLLFLRERAGAL